MRCALMIADGRLFEDGVTELSEYFDSLPEILNNKMSDCFGEGEYDH